MDDADILNFISGGITGMNAYLSKKMKIEGDMFLAQELEEVFIEAGGVEKTMAFLKAAKNKDKLASSKL